MCDQVENPVLPTEKKLMFTYASHAEQLSENLQGFYQDNQYFDVDLIAGVDGVHLQAHRVMLCTWSNYFHQLFINAEEVTANNLEFKEIDGVTMKKILDFIYMGEIDLEYETIETVLIAADHLQIDVLIDACCNYMEGLLSYSNCLGIAFFAERRKYPGLFKEAISFAHENFLEVCAEQEFLQLTEEQMCKYLSSDYLFVRSEETVFKSVVAWIEHDKQNREKSTFNILNHVRFTSLNPKFILDNRKSVCNTTEIYELICQWLLWHLSRESRAQFTAANAKSRTAELLLVSGSAKSVNGYKVYSLSREFSSWAQEEVPLSSKRRVNYNATLINQELIFERIY